ncbi:hypothetical protein [Stenotrophomonas acidaminiphila]
MTTNARQKRVEQLEGELRAKYGAEIGGTDLRTLLGYKTAESFRKAVQRGKIPVRTYLHALRRGRFASTRILAEWMESLEQAGKEGGADMT